MKPRHFHLNGAAGLVFLPAGRTLTPTVAIEASRRTMKTRSLLPFALGLLSTCLLGAQSRPSNTAAAIVSKTTGLTDAVEARLSAAYGALPLSFEPNHGQADRRAGFISRGRGYTLFLASTEAVLALRNDNGRAALTIELAHANPSADVEGLEELPGKSNYLIGADRRKWHTHVPNFAKVRYKNIYRGIDLLYYGNQQELEHDFIVSPGADPSQIAMRLEGARSTKIDARGDLILSIEGGEVVLEKPSIYQAVAGSRREISGGYVLRPTGEVAFTIGEYDRNQPLVIDPVLAYSTFIGGSGDDGFGANIAVDAAGSVYLTGSTNSTDFPTEGANQPGNNGGPSDVFVAKLNPSGSALVYSTYIGGSGDDEAFAIAVDVDGYAYVTGTTPGSPTAINFPTTPGALKSQTAAVYGSDAFVTKLSADGSNLVYSTLLGGTSTQPGAGDEVGYGIAVDPTGIAYVTGYTESANFPYTPSGFEWQAHGPRSGFLTGVNASGTALFYSTYFGPGPEATGYGVAVAPPYVYLTGSYRPFPGADLDAIVIKVYPYDAASGVYYSGVAGSADDVGNRIAVDTVGNAYVTGVTKSSDFLTTAGAFQPSANGPQDAFVVKLDSDGNILYLTYLGGSGSESGVGIALGTNTNSPVYVTGTTSSADFPTVGAFQPNYGGGMWDAFVAELNLAGAGAADLISSSYLGGSQADYGTGIAVDAAGGIYIGGYSDAGASPTDDFPTTPGAFQSLYGGGSRDAFVVKIAEPVPDLTIAKSHIGNFAQGQNGATYTITVSNIGTGPTSGTVMVTDTLPAGLTATAISGSGWTCTQPGGSCTRNDALAAGASYPAITLTVNVAANAAASVTNNVEVSGGGEVNSGNDTAADQTTVSPPTLCVNAGGTGGCYSNVQSAVDAASNGYEISIAPGTYSTSSCVADHVNFTQSPVLITINKNLTIHGAGAGSTILSGGCRVIWVTAGTVTISGVTVTGGTESLGAGGGGVRNDSNLTMIDSVITGNSSTGSGGGFQSTGGSSVFQNVVLESNTAGAFGGGLRTSSGAVTLTDVTIRNNGASAHGGILDTSGSLTLNRVTLNGNAGPPANGGSAVALGPGGSTTLTNVTISGNSGGSGVGLIVNGGSRNVVLNNVTIDGNSGTGIYQFNSSDIITVKNSIVSNNAGGDCQGTIVSGDYNLIKSTAGCTITGNVAHNVIGQDPKLVPLADNGGLTKTMALCTGLSLPSPSCTDASPAINAGNPATPGSGGYACAATDQRGVDRQTFACDIGAYQVFSGLANQSITVTTAAPASAAFNSSFPVAATASSGLAVAITTTGGCSGSGTGSASITMTSGTAACEVHYNQPGNANYSAAPEVTSNTTAGPASQNITVTTAAPASAALNSSFPVAATASSNLAVAITTSGGCSGSGSGSATITMTSSTTTCVVHYNQVGDTNYNAAPEVTSNTTAEPASQSITVTTAAPASAAFNDTFPVAATASSGLAVAIMTTGGCSIASGTVTMTSGTTACVVHFNQAGNGNYSAATEVLANVTAQKANQTISFGALANRRLNQSPFTVSATASSGLPVAFSTTTPSRCTSGGTNGATITLLATGTCTVRADQGGDGNYNPAPPVSQSFTIGNKTDQTITVGTAAPASAAYAGTFPVAATASSGLAVAITTTGGCSIAGGTVTMTSGTTACVVHFNQSGNGSYNPAPEILQSVSAQKINQTITVTTAAPANAAFNSSFPVAATASAGLGVAITTTGGCSGSGTGSANVTMTSSTTACVVRYNQAGNGNYNAAPEVLSNVTATKANQTISFGGLANRKLNQSPVTVSATASSGLPVAFTTTTPSVCTSSGTNGATITLVATGTCTVKADQSGNVNYFPAAPVTQSFTVRP
jgi:hypothetical protein